MGTSVLFGGSTTTATTARSCDENLDLFEAEDLGDRVIAVGLCEQCPLIAACRARTRTEVREGRAPLELVQAGVAWTIDGKPDPAVHGNRFRPGWLPAPTQPAERADSDIDPIAVTLMFTEPERVRDTLTASEREAVYREAARQGRSLNSLRKAFAIHPREVDKEARRLGIRDAFETKTRKPKTTPRPVVDLDAAVATPAVAAESETTAVAAPPAETTSKKTAAERIRTLLAEIRTRRPRRFQFSLPRRERRAVRVTVEDSVESFLANRNPLSATEVPQRQGQPTPSHCTVPAPAQSSPRHVPGRTRPPSSRWHSVIGCGISDPAGSVANRTRPAVSVSPLPSCTAAARRRSTGVTDGRSPPECR